jgi:hypothetical protein
MLLLAGMQARAGILPDPTGLWYIPEESGWGASVAQQGDILFVALFVHDEQRRPTWFVAPNVRDTGTHLDPIGAEVYRGTLYRVSAPWFGGTFDPNAVGVETVGTLEIAYLAFSGDPRLSVNYTVNGLRVSKSLKPQTWGSNQALFAGTYEGAFSTTALPGSACQGELGRYFPPGRVTIDVTPIAARSLSIGWTAGSESCVAEGSYTQRGQNASFSGRVLCGVAPARIEVATIELGTISVSVSGFSADSRVTAGQCTYFGRIGGVRRM